MTVTAETPVQLHPFDEGINANLSYGGASAVGQGVECPDGASITCVTTGAGATGASAAWGGASTPWSSNTLSAGTSINQVACTTGPRQHAWVSAMPPDPASSDPPDGLQRPRLGHRSRRASRI